MVQSFVAANRWGNTAGHTPRATHIWDGRDIERDLVGVVVRKPTLAFLAKVW
jgi:hypothetical protein